VVAAILNDCYYLAKEFPKIEFEHNFREANMIAHELASVTRRVNQNIWLDVPSDFIVPLLVKDN
jgi:hypothetical protein